MLEKRPNAKIDLIVNYMKRDESRKREQEKLQFLFLKRKQQQELQQ